VPPRITGLRKIKHRQVKVRAQAVNQVWLFEEKSVIWRPQHQRAPEARQVIGKPECHSRAAALNLAHHIGHEPCVEVNDDLAPGVPRLSGNPQLSTPVETGQGLVREHRDTGGKPPPVLDAGWAELRDVVTHDLQRVTNIVREEIWTYRTNNTDPHLAVLQTIIPYAQI
jgi:hypothetical protein